MVFAGCGTSFTVNDVLVEDDSASDTLNLSDAKIISVPGSNTRVAVWEHRFGLTRDESAFAIQRDGAAFSAAKRTTPELVFRDRRFDPTREPAAAAASLQVIQFYSTVLPEYLAALEKAGVELIQPFPRNAYVARMGERVGALVAKQAFVRAVTPLSSGVRIDLQGTDGERPRVYHLMSATQRPEDKGTLVAELERVGAVINRSTIDHFLLEATLDGAQLREMAASPLVLHIEPWSEAEPDVDLARELSGANFIETTLGLTGQGVRAEVMDGNVLDQHSDLKGRVTFHGPHSGDASHGTCTTGLVFGSGAGRPQARGLLPSGEAIFADYDQLSASSGAGTRDRRVHTQELVKPPYEALFQSNSWGSSLTTSYSAISAELDGILFDLDFLLFNSQSNTGSRSSRPQAWAKNVVSIGGVKHFETLAVTDDRWASGGSIGPASDGRIKPDLSHFWDATLAPASSGGYDPNFGGTSGATPMTAGLSGLFLQMWANGVFGNTTPGNTVFANRPHFTTTKAVLINTATQWAFSGASHDLTRVNQGWGRVDLARLYNVRNNLLVIDETALLAVGESSKHTVTVAPGTPELRATLTWADPAAVPSAGIHRINDLTLKVTDPNGVVYFGNNGLLASMFSSPGGSANTIDTVENVFVATPVAGAWQIEVRADDLAQDGHVETAALDADFALVVSGITARVQGTAPVLAITSPAAGEVVSGLVTVRASATDADGTVDHVRFGLPNNTFVDVKAPFTTSFETTLVADGATSFTAVAFDDQGLSSTLASVEVTVKNAQANQAPIAALTVPTGPVAGTVTFAATASDADGSIVSVTFVLPGSQTIVDDTAPYSVEFDSTQVADGRYTIEAFATDNAGAISQTQQAALEVLNPVSTAWSVSMGAKRTIVDDTTTCEVLTVNSNGEASTVRLTFYLRHSYRKALRLSLRHGADSKTIIEAGQLSASSGTTQRTNLAVPSMSGSAQGQWSLCVEDTDLTQRDKGTLNTFAVSGT